MRFKYVVCLALITSIMVTGCGGGTTDVVVEEVTATPEPTEEPTPEPTVDPSSIIYKVGEQIPISLDGTTYGYAKVNQVTKLKFSDWSNTNAAANAINTSYSVNVTICWNGEVAESEIVSMEPFFEKDGSKVSSTANLGWTGFDTSFELYSGGTTKKTIEVGVQQEVNLVGDCKLGLQFSSSDGTEFDTIYLNKKSWKNSVKGQGLLSKKDEVKIKSVTGARYSVRPKKVSLELQYVKYDDRDAGEEYFFNIDYEVKAYSKPTNNKSVSTITGVGKATTLVCHATLGLQAQGKASVLYQPSKNAGRLEYSDTDELYQYVTEGSVIHFGYKKTVTTNRQAEDGVNTNMQNVRVRVEFPEEAAAMTLKQLLKFNGRFVVYEIPLTERKLSEYWD